MRVLLALLALVAAAQAAAPPIGTAWTLSGSANAALGSVDGPVQSAGFTHPYAIVAGYEATGEFWISEPSQHTVRRLDGSGVVTFAGCGRPAYVDALGRSACFSGPTGLAFDPVGRGLFIADTGNKRIRRLSTAGPDAGRVTTVAGNGQSQPSEGPASAVGFIQPTALAYDVRSRTLYIADGFSVFALDYDGRVSLAASAGSGSWEGAPGQQGPIAAMAYDVVQDALFVAVTARNVVKRMLRGSGSLETFAGTGAVRFGIGASRVTSGVPAPGGLALDPFTGTVFVASVENGGSRVLKIHPDGRVQLLAGSGAAAGGDGFGEAASFPAVYGMALARDEGALVLAESGGFRLRRLIAAGHIERVRWNTAVLGPGSILTVLGSNLASGAPGDLYGAVVAGVGAEIIKADPDEVMLRIRAGAPVDRDIRLLSASSGVTSAPSVLQDVPISSAPQAGQTPPATDASRLSVSSSNKLVLGLEEERTVSTGTRRVAISVSLLSDPIGLPAYTWKQLDGCGALELTHDQSPQLIVASPPDGIYTLLVQVRDGSGNTGVGTVRLRVGFDERISQIIPGGVSVVNVCLALMGLAALVANILARRTYREGLDVILFALSHLQFVALLLHGQYALPYALARYADAVQWTLLQLPLPWTADHPNLESALNQAHSCGQVVRSGRVYPTGNAMWSLAPLAAVILPHFFATRWFRKMRVAAKTSRTSGPLPDEHRTNLPSPFEFPGLECTWVAFAFAGFTLTNGAGLGRLIHAYSSPGTTLGARLYAAFQGVLLLLPLAYAVAVGLLLHRGIKKRKLVVFDDGTDGGTRGWRPNLTLDLPRIDGLDLDDSVHEDEGPDAPRYPPIAPVAPAPSASAGTAPFLTPGGERSSAPVVNPRYSTHSSSGSSVRSPIASSRFLDRFGELFAPYRAVRRSYMFPLVEMSVKLLRSIVVGTVIVLDRTQSISQDLPQPWRPQTHDSEGGQALLLTVLTIQLVYIAFLFQGPFASMHLNFVSVYTALVELLVVLSVLLRMRSVGAGEENFALGVCCASLAAVLLLLTIQIFRALARVKDVFCAGGAGPFGAGASTGSSAPATPALGPGTPALTPGAFTVPASVLRTGSASAATRTPPPLPEPELLAGRSARAILSAPATPAVQPQPAPISPLTRSSGPGRSGGPGSGMGGDVTPVLMPPLATATEREGTTGSTTSSSRSLSLSRRSMPASTSPRSRSTSARALQAPLEHSDPAI